MERSLPYHHHSEQPAFMPCRRQGTDVGGGAEENSQEVLPPLGSSQWCTVVEWVDPRAMAVPPQNRPSINQGYPMAIAAKEWMLARSRIRRQGCGSLGWWTSNKTHVGERPSSGGDICYQQGYNHWVHGKKSTLETINQFWDTRVGVIKIILAKKGLPYFLYNKQSAILNQLGFLDAGHTNVLQRQE